MGHTFDTLDVFTSRPLAGNPLAVVYEADGLDPGRMQAIAREFNLSETVFVMKPENPAHWARVRIFTPARELPFAGHPTIGTAVVLAERRLGTSEEHDAIVTLEEEVGLVRVGVVILPGEVTYAEFDLPKMPEELDAPNDREAVARAVGLMGSDIGFDNHRPTNFTAGVPYGFVPVRDPATLSRAEPVSALWKSVRFGGTAMAGAFVYTRAKAGSGHVFAARMFAPLAGIPEDPATGSAVAAFAGVGERFEALGPGRHVVPIEQGADMGRPSEIVLEVEFTGGGISAARIGGSAVRVMEGSVNL